MKPSRIATSALRDTYIVTALVSSVGKAAVQRSPRQSHAAQKMLLMSVETFEKA